MASFQFWPRPERSALWLCLKYEQRNYVSSKQNQLFFSKACRTFGKPFSLPCNSSRVFRDLLTTDTEERRSDQIQLQDFELETGEVVLVYVYDNKLPDGADLMPLLMFADKYDMAALKKLCAKGLVEKVSDANYLKVWIFKSDTATMSSSRTVS